MMITFMLPSWEHRDTYKNLRTSRQGVRDCVAYLAGKRLGGGRISTFFGRLTGRLSAWPHTFAYTVLDNGVLKVEYDFYAVPDDDAIMLAGSLAALKPDLVKSGQLTVSY